MAKDKKSFHPVGEGEQAPDAEEEKKKKKIFSAASLTLLSAFVGSMSAFGIFVLNFLRYIDGQ